MALRFIFACMVVVALCLAAIPLMPAFDGIEGERNAILAAQQADNYVLSVPPQLAEPAADMQFASEDDLSNIEPAAGDMPADQGFGGNFGGEAPSALSEPAVPEASLEAGESE